MGVKTQFCLFSGKHTQNELEIRFFNNSLLSTPNLSKKGKVKFEWLFI